MAKEQGIRKHRSRATKARKLRRQGVRKGGQLPLMAKQGSSYGGELLKKREGRAHGRPLSTTNTMHLVLRSSRAKEDWSFRRPKNKKGIREIVLRFSAKYGISASINWKGLVSVGKWLASLSPMNAACSVRPSRRGR